MTDSVDGTRATGGKRERLVVAAGDLFHRQGIPATTLAHVAEAADVPLGNVYYYFKTKDDLIRAVVDDRLAGVDALLATFDHRRSPATRLKALPRHWADMRDLIAAYGCPLGTLSAALDSRTDDLGRDSAAILRRLVDWAETQFRQLGRRDAGDLAIGLIGSVQGAALLASAFRDPDLMAAQARALERWIDGLSG